MREKKKTNIIELWDYFLFLEKDFQNTSKYMQPRGQEDVFSYEYVKIIILSCIEVESLFKLIGSFHNIKLGKNAGICKYKETILGKYPNIIKAEVYDTKVRKMIKPFKGWDDIGKLSWWDAYNSVKHNRSMNYSLATYNNAALSLAAVYILLLYLAEITKESIPTFECEYFDSKYNYSVAAWGPLENLPDLPDKETKRDSLYKYINDGILKEDKDHSDKTIESQYREQHDLPSEIDIEQANSEGRRIQVQETPHLNNNY